MTERLCNHAIVLAGGQSRRMGRDKAGIEFAGLDQLTRSIELLRRHVAHVFVSVRPDQARDPLRAAFPQIVDAHDGLGPLAGILSALERRPVPWLVLACDLPRVDDPTVARLLAAIDRDSIATAYAATGSGLPEPLCAVWMPSALGPIRDAVAAGKTCPRKILIRHSATLIAQPVDDALDNMNTPEDLARIGAPAGARAACDRDERGARRAR